MSVSSVASPTPVVPLNTGAAPQPSSQSNSSDSTDGYQPPPKPPLPPGQGTQVDQLA
jgi:hypothetical protein